MKFRKLIAALAAATSIVFSLPVNTAYAQSYLVTYNGKSHKNSIISYYLNKDEIKTKYPGIIMDNGVSVASAKDIFTNSGMGITYKYSSKNKKLILYHDSDRISFTIGKKYAYVNGKKRTISSPATFIKYPDGKSRLCVPARFVASNFGFSYQYYSDSDMAVISGTVNDNLKLKYNGKTYNYTGSRLICSVDGTDANSESNPAVYMYQTLMGPVNYVFSKSEIGAKYSYNKSKKTVTLTYNKKKLVMTLGSKTAKLGSKKVTLSEAPVSVNYLDSKRTNILVPVEEVAKYLGLTSSVKGNVCSIVLPKSNGSSSDSDTKNNSDEKKDDNTATSSAVEDNTKPAQNNSDSGSKDNNTNSGSETNNNSTSDQTNGNNNQTTNTTASDGNIFTFSPTSDGNTYLNTVKAGVSGSCELTGLTATEGTTSYSSLDSLAQSDTVTNGIYDTYTLTSNSGFYGISGSFSGNTINIRLSNMIANDNTQYFSNGIANSATVNYDASTMTSTVKFDTNSAASYTCSLSADAKVLTVKMYRNGITGITGEYKNGSAYINISGVTPVSVTDITADQSRLLFKINNISDTLGAQNYTISDNSGLLTMVSYAPNSDGTATLEIDKDTSKKYYVTAAGNTTSLVIMPSASIELSPNTVIPLPDGVTESDIGDKDDEYNNKKFTIYIKGDYASFYNTNTIQYSSAVKDVSVKYENGKTAITFTTHKLQAYKMSYSSGSLNLQIGDPKDVYSKIVVLDAGHGGHDDGTRSGKTLEKDLNLTIIHNCMENCKSDPNLKIYYTREDDTFITLNDRAAYASKVGADFFISLHMNSASSAAKGTEVWYSSTNNSKTSSGLTSYKLAETLCENLTSKLGNANRGVKNNIFVVTKKNTVPAVLVELGFVSNSSDLKKLTDPDYQQKAAQVIYDSIEQIFNEYPTGR